ncbi:ABC transporter ATP-binding protein [Rossellomorea vietnamensis]|uniref:Carnitine transport ATP-binding protein OpuCA n=1 Tax=Rossellomorea vietnamensis TaxID=218284 RepID=A0A5D4MHG3_9BACI|nr:ABC transporter ATP-binding protein [Rossellomorea vietnamensis]TYS01173.1 ABC transporter ATP-binding protein [Rossellomorea vietnamensis]
MSEIHLDNIKKSFEVKNGQSDRAPFSIGPVNLFIENGEFFTIIGPSGSGKSTLLRLVAGLIEPSEGNLFVNGVDVTGNPAETRNFSMVFQEALLFPHMNVAENVAFGLKIKRINKKERMMRVKRILEKVGLNGYENKNPAELSGGQQQRVSLARALVMDPHVLLMDEPFSALDFELREEMRDLVKTIAEDSNTTLIFVTHDREEAFQLSDRIAIIVNGRVVQVGTPHQLYTAPSTIESAAFLGAKNILKGFKKDGAFTSVSSTISFQTTTKNCENDGHCHLILRPELFYPDDREGQAHQAIDGEGVIRVSGVVTKSSFYQGIHHLKLDEGTMEIQAKIQLMYEWHVQEGDHVTLTYPISHAIII